MANKKKNQGAQQISLTVTLPATACQLLAENSGLPKERIKQAMAKGAVWLNRPGAKERRLRKAKFQLKPNDSVQLFYDPKILAQTPPRPICVGDEKEYSVWFKPSWLLSQGSRYGDHCSLLRLVEKERKDIDCKLIHRLDREVSGLVILAHNRTAARLLSELFQEGDVKKRYFAEVQGVIKIPPEGVQLTTPVDGKSAHTEILFARPGKNRETTILDILLHSGRLHQIRRHLSEWGHPILGDQKYGTPSKTADELHLCAWKIGFTCPFSGKRMAYKLPERLKPSFLSSP
ncbi:MAG: RluA family pseudouridine synthase [Thermodesulfobacteriota bacterium]